MKKELFTRIFNAVCVSFPANCKGCPFKEASEKNGCASCDDFRADYQRNAEQVLAEWIAEGTIVAPLDKPEPQKAPDTRREILQAAERCVCGDRDNQYGRPENSFRVIPAFWTQYIMSKCVPKKTTVDIGPDDVAAMMVLFKMARVATGQNKADNWVDGVGYCACGGEIAGKVRE